MFFTLTKSQKEQNEVKAWGKNARSLNVIKFDVTKIKNMSDALLLVNRKKGDFLLVEKLQIDIQQMLHKLMLHQHCIKCKLMSVPLLTMKISQ